MTVSREDNPVNDKVGWRPLSVIVTILFALIMASFTLAGNALSKASENEGDIKAIHTDVSYIREGMDDIKKLLMK